MTDSPTFGQRIAAARVRRGWTQKELAARLGVGRRTLQRWEVDEEIPQLRAFAALVELLRLHPGNMLRALPPEPMSAYEAMVMGATLEREEA